MKVSTVSSEESDDWADLRSMAAGEVPPAVIPVAAPAVEVFIAPESGGVLGEAEAERKFFVKAENEHCCRWVLRGDVNVCV